MVISRWCKMNTKLKIKIIELFGSQTEFSKVTGIPENLISRFIRRHKEPTPEQKQCIADALHVTVEFLFAPAPDSHRYSAVNPCLECRKLK